MSGDLKQQWGVGDPAQVGPDAQSQDLKAAFEKPMDAMAEHLQFTAANGERARHDPLAARSEALVPRYQSALGEVDPADPAKAKPSIDSLLANTESLGQEVAAFRSETEKAAAEWQSRAASYDAAVVQVEELQEWQHPKEGPLRGLVDGIRGNVNDRAYAKAIAVLDQFLPKLQPIYEDFQRQKAAQQEYEPASAALQPRLVQAAQPTFAKLAPQQSEIATGQSTMEASAQGRDFVAALAAVSTLGSRVDTYTTAVEELTRFKQEYEEALAQVQPKLQAAPTPSPFQKLASQQAELASGQQQMESAAQAEEFEQALQQANDLGTKADAYTAAVEELTRLKQEYEQALAQVQPKLQAAPNPSPFQKLAAQQAELASGQQQMESAAQAEEFEQALQQANDLGTKADAYTAAVEELTRLKQEYEQALAQVQPKLQGAPNPSPFQKLAAQQAELASGQQQMESAAQAEEFEQALQQANDLGTKAEAYTAAVEELTRLKQEYEQALAQVQPKLQAAPNPSPFQKLASQQEELASGQQQMESAAQAEEFEQALQQANDLGTKADAYTAAVEELARLKQEYEQALAQVQPKLQAAPNPSPFNKLSAQQAELTSGQQQMESAAQAEEFEQALQQANDLGTKAEAYTAAVEELTRLKQEYEQALAQVQPKLQAAPNPSPFQKLAAQQAELASGQQQMESAAQAEEFEQALQQANDLGTKADAYTAAVEELTRLKQEYEQAMAQVQPKLQAAPNPSPFNKLSAQQAELTSGQQQMESAAQTEEFEQALQQANELGTKAEAYTAAVEELTRLKQEYEQALAQVQPKLQAAPDPSPFQKLAAQQAELASGQQQMESAAQAEEFEQALQQANDLGTKADAYTAAVEELTRLKQEYEQAMAQVQPKLQAAPNPSPFQKLAAQQAELASGQQQMESAAQAEEFEQALQQANDLGTKADAYTAAVEELARLKQEYEQAMAQVQPKLQAAPNPSPFQKLAAQQAELASGQQQMESAAQTEEFEQALQQANDLGTKAEAYTAAVEELTRLKQEYEQALAQVQPKLQAAPNPSPFQKLASQQEELASGQQQMESAAQAEEFEQALQQANDLGTKADAYTAAVEELARLKQEYEQALAQVQPKLQAAPNPSPFQKLASQQEELASGQQQMESAAQTEEFEQALAQANELGTKADTYTAAVAELTRLKQEYEQALGQVQPKLQAAPTPSPFPQLEPMQADLVSGQQQMESAVQSEEFQQALQQANELGTKADAYTAEIEKLKQSEAKPEAADAAVEFAGEIELGPGAKVGNVVLATSFRNVGSGVLESGRVETWVQVIDQNGSIVHSQRAEPPNERMDPQGTSRTTATAPVTEGNYGVRFRLHLDGKQVAEKVATMEVRPQTVDLHPGKAVPEAPPTDDRVPDLQWEGEIEPSPGAVAGNVSIGCRYRNDSDFPAQAGVVQGLLNVLDSKNNIIASGWLEPAGEIAPGATRWSAGTLKLPAGLYGVKLSMLVLGRDVGRQKVGTLEVGAQSVGVRGGSLPETQPDKHLEVDSDQIAMQWTGDIDVSIVNGNEFSIAHPFRNAGPQEIELAWIQGKISPQVIASGAYTGEHFMECLVATLKPGDIAPMRYAGHLPSGQYAVTLTLQQTHKVLDKKVGYLSIDEKDGNCEVRWSWTAPKVQEPGQTPAQLSGAPATIAGVSPDRTPAKGGTPVVITGTGFTGASAVTFGSDSNKIPARFTVDSDSQITATTPDSTRHYTSGSDLEVFVTTPAGPSQRAGGHVPTVKFGETPAKPSVDLGPQATVSEVSPNVTPAKGGTQVVITGTGFTGATAVAFGSDSNKIPARFTVDSDSQITATTPDSTRHYTSGSDLEVFVTTPAGPSQRAGGHVPTVKFGETPAKPSVDLGPQATVSEVSPNVTPAKGGTQVVITGTGFTGATAVAFGSDSNKIPARFTVDSDSQITATTPDSTRHYTSGSDLEVFVTTPAGPSQRAGGHVPTVTFGERSDRRGTPPTVSWVNPNRCPMAGDTRVTLSGSGFTGAVQVAFGGLPARFVVDSDTQITATTPDSTRQHPPGSELPVVVSTVSGSSPTGPAAPRVTFGERGERGDVSKEPKKAEPELKSAEDQRKELEHLSPKGEDARKKEGSEAYTKALGKVAEGVFKSALETSEAKKVEEALAKLPFVVKYVVPVATLAAATAGLASKHGEFPISDSPDIALPIPGSLKVTAKVTWKGPVDHPTEATLTVTLESRESKPPAGSRDEIARQVQLLKDDLLRWQPKAKFEKAPKISGDLAPPLPQGGGAAPVLIANFDFSKGEGKRAGNLDQMSDEIMRRSGGTKGQVQVVAYFVPVVTTDEESQRKSSVNQERAAQNAAETQKSLTRKLPGLKSRIKTLVLDQGSGRAFGLSSADKAALGTHEVAVIFAP